MTRLAATVHGDVRLQFRQGFYFASAFVVLALFAAGRYVPSAHLTWILPVLVFSAVQTNAFYFMAGLVLLEKSEGTLAAQVVTPLRTGEYLASKVTTLTLLTLAENAVLAWALWGFGIAWLPYLAGLTLGSVVFSLAGFLAIVRYDSINEFLVPSILYTSLLGLPLLPFLGVWDHPVFFLHPLQPSLLLIAAGFEPGAPWLWAYALVCGAAWCPLLAALSLRAFHRFVVTPVRSR